MKNNYYTLFSILLVAIILSSCSSTNIMTLSVTDPAPVYIPDDVKSIGLVNRSLPSEKNKLLDKVDQVLTIEEKNLDKEGAEQAIDGLKDELLFNQQFTKIERLDGIDLTNNGLGVFPAPLPWDQVSDLCKNNNVDILYVLEFFDTDSKPVYSSRHKNVANNFGVNIPVTEHIVSITTIIKTGWRIYDPVNKTINDELVGRDKVVSVGSGISPLVAVKAVQGRKQAVNVSSNKLGKSYAKRILPIKHRVSRDYYVRGSNNFKIAKRRAQTGDWNGAADLWEQELLNPKKKATSRAHYNMAIYKEIQGELDSAIDFASKAYTDFKDQRALRYVKILEQRKRNVSILK